MIKVDDLTGNVTMSLSDYEKLRDRNNEERISLEKSLSDFKEEKEKFEEGLFKKGFTRQHSGYSIGGYGYDSCNPPYLETEYSWLTKEEILKQLEEKYRTETTKFQENIENKLRFMNVFQFMKWRKNWT